MSQSPLPSDEVIRRHHSRSSRGDRAPPYSKQRSVFRLDPEHIPEFLPPETQEETDRREAHARARAARRVERERQHQAAPKKRNLAIFGAPENPHQGLTRTRTVDVAAHHRLSSLDTRSDRREGRTPSTGSRRGQLDREHPRCDDEPQSRHGQDQERERVRRQDVRSSLESRLLGASYRTR